jgi:hypothetical protein
MSTTPEGKVKREVKDILHRFEPKLYQFWPVQMGMGTSTLDCIGSYCGFAFAIETKAPGGKPTARQETVIEQMREAGVMVFVIDGTGNSLDELRCWLQSLQVFNMGRR